MDHAPRCPLRRWMERARRCVPRRRQKSDRHHSPRVPAHWAYPLRYRSVSVLALDFDHQDSARRPGDPAGGPGVGPGQGAAPAPRGSPERDQRSDPAIRRRWCDACDPLLAAAVQSRPHPGVRHGSHARISAMIVVEDRMMETHAAHTATTPTHFVVVPHTHWDREWYQPFQDFRSRLVRLMDRLLDLLERDTAFAHFHLDGQTIVLEDYLEIRPQNRARLRRLISAGRNAIGPWYVLPDEFLVSGESIVRNLQIGHRIAGEFGGSAKVGYLPDQFGHIAQMPQILAGFNIDCAAVCCGVGADVTQTLFIWEGLDGTRVFTAFMPRSGYSNARSLPEDIDALRQRLGAIGAEPGALPR